MYFKNGLTVVQSQVTTLHKWRDQKHTRSQRPFHGVCRSAIHRRTRASLFRWRNAHIRFSTHLWIGLRSSLRSSIQVFQCPPAVSHRWIPQSTWRGDTRPFQNVFHLSRRWMGEWSRLLEFLVRLTLDKRWMWSERLPRLMLHYCGGWSTMRPREINIRADETGDAIVGDEESCFAFGIFWKVVKTDDDWLSTQKDRIMTDDGGDAQVFESLWHQ